MITLAYGVPGAGKSTLLHDLVRAQADLHLFFVNDHEAGWGQDAVHWRGKPPPLTLVETEGELETLEQRPADEWPASGVYVFRHLEANRIVALLVAKGNGVYVDDELDLLARRQGWETSPLRTVVHQGRHALNEEGVPTTLHLYGACRRPQNLHTDVSSLADEVYMFRLQGKNTLKRCVDDNFLEEEQWELVRTLPKFEFIHWPSGKHLALAPIGDGKAAPREPLQGTASEDT